MPATRPVSRSPRITRRDERERQLIGATLDCISSLGLSDTTVQAVAARAGMAVGSISQYFDSKSRLFTAVLEHLSVEFEAAWRAAGAEARAREPRRAVCACVCARGGAT